MTDRLTIRLVITFIGIFALVGLAGIIWLIDEGTAGVDLAIIAGPTGVALGALGSMLAHTSSTPNPPS